MAKASSTVVIEGSEAPKKGKGLLTGEFGGKGGSVAAARSNARGSPHNLMKHGIDIPRRDIRNLVSLERLRGLTDREIEVLSYKLAGHSHADIARIMHLDQVTVKKALAGEHLLAVYAEASLNLRLGLVSPEDLAQAMEPEVLRLFHERMTDPECDDEWKFKFGQAILKHRLDMMKAVGNILPQEGLPDPMRRRVESFAGEVRDRILRHLGAKSEVISPE